MKVDDIFFNPIMNLPHTRDISEYKTFYEYAIKLLDDYKDLILKIESETNKIDCMYGYVNMLTLSIEKIKRIISEICDQIKKILESYYNGFPNQAYLLLAELFNKKISTKYNSYYGKLFRAHPLKNDIYFYRLRYSEFNVLFKKHEMFHIPFDYREKIKTHRYGIPGYPTLYLSNCIYLAWEELGRPNINNFQASRYEFNNYYDLKNFYFLDLTNSIMHIREKIKLKNEYGNPNIGYYLLIFPLILMCSIKVNNVNAHFKPEYIIPQLIMQYTRFSNEKILGVKFSSTHVNQNINASGKLYNLAIPPRKINISGYCPELVKFFKISEPISNQIIGITNANKISPHHNEQEYLYINKEVKKIQLEELKPVVYGETIFGRMEKYLKNLDTSSFT